MTTGSAWLKSEVLLDNYEIEKGKGMSTWRLLNPVSGLGRKEEKNNKIVHKVCS